VVEIRPSRMTRALAYVCSGRVTTTIRSARPIFQLSIYTDLGVHPAIGLSLVGQR